MPKGLGANIGDEKWENAVSKKEKIAKYSNQLRNMNKKFGLLNADKSE
tara:strand:- start:678 stop:821 length:144 start_codon:yes stop_codon:yes gene_type:complete